MSIIEPTDHTIGPAPVASPQDVVVDPPAPEPEPPELSKEDDPDWFPRDYVEKLRDEAAAHRVRARDYEDTFSDMPDDLRAGVLQLAQLIKSDDPDARDYIAELLGFEPTPAEAQAISDLAEQQAPLTREEMAEIAREEARSLYEEQRSELDQQRAVEDVQTRAKALGYDPTSPDYVLLLKFANDMDAPDLDLAHAKVQEYQQAQYDAFIARKEAEAATSPAAPSGTAVSPSIVTPPRSWDEARNSLHERLSAQ